MITINKTNRPLVYLEIVNEYIKLIKLKAIKYDEKLPSVRELAKELGINPNTVSKAYQELETLGYVSISPKKGVYVIYSENANDEIKNIIKAEIEKIKSSNITRDELKKLIDEVYLEEEND